MLIPAVGRTMLNILITVDTEFWPDRGADQAQLALFGPEGPSAAERSVLGTLRELDPERTTPLDALRLLARLRAQLDEGGGA